MRAINTFLAITCLAVAGCAATEKSAVPGDGLREVMGRLAADGPGATYLDYGDMAHWRKLGVVTDEGPGSDRRWLTAVGFGFGDLSARIAILPERTEIRAFAADRAVSAGVPPNTAIRVEGGLDAAAIREKLTGYGAKPRTIGGREGLTFAPDHEISRTRLTTELGLVTQLNQVVVTDSALVAGSAAAPVAAMLDAGGSSLNDRPEHAAVAECLGDVVTATVYAPRQPSGVSLYGVGLRRPAKTSDQAVNVVCVLPRVAEVVQTFTSRFVLQAQAGGKPLAQLADRIEHDEVRSGDLAVRRATVTVKREAPVALAHQMVLRAELERLADPGAP
ncbi:hypothetical protein [Nonomuraea roseola]|uniref:Lipoprotein n=1 Tax=Nonomuraea roseola TaxID=46179 RepID=A0ABV5QDM2_9ACTN